MSIKKRKIEYPASLKLRQTSAKKPRVAVGMSGGVDSSVAAAILKDRGYDVVGFMMKLWSDSSCAVSRENSCCDIEGLHDAKRIAAVLDIPFYVVDVRKRFKSEVADYFIEEYKNLRTPNPCVRCNERIKFGWMLDFARKSGCDYLATGHYARIAMGNSGKLQVTSYKLQKEPIDQSTNQPINYHLLRGKDENKDQSYFLYGLSQEQLNRIMFPVGGMTKPEVRALAKKLKLPVHEKAESQEICFIQDRDYREFLKRHIPKNYFKPGDIVDSKGRVLGRHDGLINYTIGQRRGIEQSRASKITNYKLQITNKNLNLKIDKFNENCKLKIVNSGDKSPLYVTGFDVKNNQLVVGLDHEVYRQEMIVEDLKWVDPNLQFTIYNLQNLKVKIRYRHEAVGCKVQKTDNRKQITVLFDEPQRAITPGQSAVFYRGDEILGGGIIQ